MGVTNPWKANLAPGGPIGSFAWKPITPGLHGGFYESYKSELAAYRLDRLLELGMVPVTVERRVERSFGSATMWLTPAQSFRDLGGPPKPPSSEAERWSVQLIRAKMFDNLINNVDPNLGNWMVDPAWNLCLIDHSRAFLMGKRMVHEMTRIDPDLWERMKRLNEKTVTAAMAGSLPRKKIKGLLKRRDVMAKKIAELIDAKGERDVFVRFADP